MQNYTHEDLTLNGIEVTDLDYTRNVVSVGTDLSLFVEPVKVFNFSVGNLFFRKNYGVT